MRSKRAVSKRILTCRSLGVLDLFWYFGISTPINYLRLVLLIHCEPEVKMESLPILAGKGKIITGTLAGLVCLP